MPEAKSPYREVRALERGLMLLEALGQLGWSTPGTLAKQTGIDRSSVYRILKTLMLTNYVTYRPGDSRYALTSKMQWIASHVWRAETDAQIVIPHLATLVRQIHWPSDFASIVRGVLSIQASNHSLTTMSIHRSVVGQRRPILRTSLGQAILAALPPDDLTFLLDVVRETGGQDAADLADTGRLQAAIDETRARGYASQRGNAEARFGGIALPVMDRERVVGAVNVLYFVSAMSADAAAARYLGPLRQTVQAIERAFADAE